MSGILCEKRSLGVGGEISNSHSISKTKQLLEKKKWANTNGETEQNKQYVGLL